MKYLLCLASLLAAPVLALELNNATFGQLMDAGFSAASAQHIIDARQHGTLRTPQALLQIDGVTPDALRQLRSPLTLDGITLANPAITLPPASGTLAAKPAPPASESKHEHPGRDSVRDGHRDASRSSAREGRSGASIPVAQP